MKIKILLYLFMIFSSLFYIKGQKLEQNGNPQIWIKNNDVESIAEYCKRALFFTYGIYGGEPFPIDNSNVEKIIALLKHGADLGNAECQFMLACIFSGNKTIRGHDEEDYDKEVEIPTPKDYKYLNDAEAEKYFHLYLSNPKMNKECGAFGYSYDTIKIVINNAYPYLIELHTAKERLKVIERMASDEIKTSAPTFGLQ